MDARLWVYLDNLRWGWHPSMGLTDEQHHWAALQARELGFVSDQPRPGRLTRKGEIAIRIPFSTEG